MLGKNSLDSPWLMFLLSEGICSSKSHRCEWRNGPDDLVCIMILLYRLISNDMIVVETICLWTIVVCYCGGCVPLVVTVSLVSSCVLLRVVVYHWIVVVYCYE
jgi:hypothetical protein